MEFTSVSRQLAVFGIVGMQLVLGGCWLEEPVEEPAADEENSAENNAPNISGVAPQSIKVNVNYSFTPSASDPESDILIFSINNRPNWANFDTTTGTLSGMPFAGTEGSYSGIVISANDGQYTSSLPAFVIKVTSMAAANLPPHIDGSAAPTVVSGSPYSFTPTASDPDGDPLTFNIVNRPNWADFNSATGKLSGVPFPGTEGSYSGIVITASDGQYASSLPAFAVRVKAPLSSNKPPQIIGSAAPAIIFGDNYTFVPTATDPDDDPLTFSIFNQPPWATFDSTTGKLSGTPQSGDVGQYPGIVISVSDGELMASLDAFAISVDQMSLGSVTLSWAAPTQNIDGSALTDLSGYRIYYGTSVGNYPNSIAIDNPGLTTYVVDNLVPGTYFFAATAMNSQGVESDYSNIGQKLVQ